MKPSKTIFQDEYYKENLQYLIQLELMNYELMNY